MSDALAAAGPEAVANFASFLANLAALEPESVDVKPAGTGDADRWDFGDLAEDVATISKVHERPSAEAVVATAAKRRSASVTIRVSEEECAQLHQRAAEAGLTVSAYLRSCVFEAEELRAQVKEALAQFNAATAAEKTEKREEVQRARPNLRRRLFGR